MKKFFGEFKEFAFKGNVLNLAVGIIIGAAFQNITNSLTGNILSPLIGLFTGQSLMTWHVDFFGADLMLGAFITSVINFIIMAFVIFLIVKGMTRLASVGRKPTAAEEPATQTCPYCLTDISGKAVRCPACTSHLTAE